MNEELNIESVEDVFIVKDGKLSIRDGIDASFATKFLVDKVNESARNQNAESMKDLLLKATVAAVASIDKVLEGYKAIIAEIQTSVAEQTASSNNN
ncbi:hypothetical protein PP939_gp231 [Rhizobium phage RL38J1]|uniref:Uncharacterized protein n=1 Tax=Rhizobium phage RL38J1 TaxID=2663232 RepID=A0A6B9J5J1_9CAUD|nr:hypothetical protein PP939_gp231 [Rhizobium phage RL38J1]QGZ13995.1 hypothetical protein RL38J1_231 [Rhizobium phage RL38J1]